MPRSRAAFLLTLPIALMLGFAACKKEAPPPPAAPAAAPAPAPAPAPTPPPAEPAAAPAEGVALVEVFNDGVVKLNGAVSTFEAVKAFVKDEKTKPKEIHYRRAESEKDPSETAAPLIHDLLQFLMDSGVPVRLAK